MATRTEILNTLDDMVANFLYYDRKEDDRLPVGAIERAIKKGKLTVDDLVTKFRESMEQGLR
jgi:hypothetical protein